MLVPYDGMINLLFKKKEGEREGGREGGRKTDATGTGRN